MLEQIRSIPNIFKAIMLSFLVIMMIRVTYPIANYVLGLFEASMMKYSAILVYWLITIFVTWFLFWAVVFKPSKTEGGNQ